MTPSAHPSAIHPGAPTWLAALLLATLLASCSPAATQATPRDDLIVAGERVGDLAHIGQAGREIADRDPSLVTDRTDATVIVFEGSDGEKIYEVILCRATEEVRSIVIYDHPSNERFATGNGLSLASSEAEVHAGMGEPDAFADDIAYPEGIADLSRYDPAEGEHIMFAFLEADKTRAWYIVVSQTPRCP